MPKLNLGILLEVKNKNTIIISSLPSFFCKNKMGNSQLCWIWVFCISITKKNNLYLTFWLCEGSRRSANGEAWGSGNASSASDRSNSVRVVRSVAPASASVALAKARASSARPPLISSRSWSCWGIHKQFDFVLYSLLRYILSKCWRHIWYNPNS